MTEIIRADQPIAYYNLPGAESPLTLPLRVAEIIPEEATPGGLHISTKGFYDVVRAGWMKKFHEPGILTTTEVANVVGTPMQQEQRIKTEVARQGARYLITSLGYKPVERPDDVRAVLRMELHRPRHITWGNLSRDPYPAITHLESRNGKLFEGEYNIDALALMATALRRASPWHKVLARTERQNGDGINFFTSLEFDDRHRDERVQVGRRPRPNTSSQPTEIDYVHMEADQARHVQGMLAGVVEWRRRTAESESSH